MLSFLVVAPAVCPTNGRFSFKDGRSCQSPYQCIFRERLDNATEERAGRDAASRVAGKKGDDLAQSAGRNADDIKKTPGTQHVDEADDVRRTSANDVTQKEVQKFAPDTANDAPENTGARQVKECPNNQASKQIETESANKTPNEVEPVKVDTCDSHDGISCNANSFMAGTLVLAADGLVPIEEIQEGDCVLAENPETGEQEYKEVIALTDHPEEELVYVTVEFDDETSESDGNGDETAEDGDADSDDILTLEVTQLHPIYVEDKGWVNADNLEVGDQLRRSDGGIAKVLAVEQEMLETAEDVYNFTVANLHTYFVGDEDNNALLVHNVSDTCDVPDQNAEERAKSVEEYMRSKSHVFTEEDIARTSEAVQNFEVPDRAVGEWIDKRHGIKTGDFNCEGGVMCDYRAIELGEDAKIGHKNRAFEGDPDKDLDLLEQGIYPFYPDLEANYVPHAEFDVDLTLNKAIVTDLDEDQITVGDLITFEGKSPDMPMANGEYPPMSYHVGVYAGDGLIMAKIGPFEKQPFLLLRIEDEVAFRYQNHVSGAYHNPAANHFKDGAKIRVWRPK